MNSIWGDAVNINHRSCVLALLTVCALLGTLSTGCAFGDRKIALTYTPALQSTRGNGGRIAVAKFGDTRQNKLVVGEVRNGYGLKTAKATIPNEDAGGWVANALASELEGAGYQIVKINDSTQTDEEIVVSGCLSEFYTKSYMKYRTTVKANIQVYQAGVPLLNKEYIGKCVAGVAWYNTSEFEKVSCSALQDLMKQAVPDIVAVLR